MKSLFSVLLIANLGMFIWLYPQHDGSSGQAVIPADVGELRLVGETLSPAGELTASEAGEQELAGETGQDSGEAVPEPPSRVPPMIVSSDLAVSPPVSQADASAQVSSPVCGTLGQFEKRSQAELVSVRLLAQGGKTEITSETTNDQAGYWVLVPPQQNRAAAINIAKRLEEAGVSDLWRFTSGELAHAISLGLFRDQERAQARSDKINEMGFASEVRPRFREKTLYWLNYRYEDPSSFQDEYWRELKASFPDLQRNEKPCP